MRRRKVHVRDPFVLRFDGVRQAWCGATKGRIVRSETALRKDEADIYECCRPVLVLERER